ncbi:MAG: hypothetical protein E7657_01690 [Ruminococcaceae bacterium]|nr:hypothetical protein [Oscillospiraceae bacterium]
MKKTRIIALLLVLAMLLMVFASCDGTGSKGDGGDRGDDGSWEGVDFDGQEVHMSISANQYEECSFPAADIYTKGPDTAGSNDVAKEVLARNARVSEELGINIKYSTTNLRYPEVFSDIESIVMTSAKNSPDIYSNDLIGLGKAMVNGFLWNVKNPGEGVKNYFDFSKDGWYEEYIKGCTFDQEKLYIFAGDYFIDMIRMAWAIYVNETIFTANISQTKWKSLDEFYADVEAGLWSMDDLATMVTDMHADGAGGTPGKADRTDEIIGMALNHTTDWVFASTSEADIFYQDKEDGYKPKVVETATKFIQVSDKWMTLANSTGAIETESSVQGVKEATTIFLEGKTLFVASRLGEMESQAVREFKADKGLVPFPKWNLSEQEDYHTVIHNQVELGAILNSAKAFSAASALMQFLNEESEKVVYTYYEKGLKYKYNDNKNARAMMDLIRETSDAPFGFEIGDLTHETFYTADGAKKLTLMYLDNNSTLASTFDSEKGVYVDCLNKMLERFATFE